MNSIFALMVAEHFNHGLFNPKLQFQTFQPQSQKVISTPNFSTMNFSTPDFSSMNCSTTRDLSTMNFSTPKPKETSEPQTFQLRTFQPRTFEKSGVKIFSHQQVLGHFNPRLLNHELLNPLVQYIIVEKLMIEKSSTQKSGVEKFFLALALKILGSESPWFKCLGLKSPGLKCPSNSSINIGLLLYKISGHIMNKLHVYLLCT